MKKIMFDDKYGLTKAVLEGRKTMTRRNISKRVRGKADAYYREYYENTLDALSEEEALLEFSTFKPGEVVAVAQSYESIHDEMMAGDYGDCIYDAFRWAYVADSPGWGNKMFVSAGLMPHQIRITNVRVERMQDISDEDCLREGIRKMTFDTFSFDSWKFFVYNPREAFAALIDRISGKGTWEANPWVYAYEFELVK